MRMILKTHRLELKHTWTIARGSTDFKEYNFVELQAEGITGIGEAAHNVRYGESLESIQKFLVDSQPLLESINFKNFYSLGQSILEWQEGQDAAKAALDIALLDLITKRLKVSLYEYWGLNKSKTPVTSYSIGIDKPEIMQEKIRAAAEFPILKIKLGS
ncbi:dipeptide epimerase, partial [candidate division KSB1 bacterium]